MATTANGTAKRTNPRGTKKYKALIAAQFSDDEALSIMGVKVADPKVAELVAGGFSQEQAEALVAGKGGKGKGKGKKAKKAKAEKVEKALTVKEKADALVANAGLTFARGRVYMTGEIVEQVVRVLKGASPQVVKTSGVGRVKAVLVYREESGDVAVQNLTTPA